MVKPLLYTSIAMSISFLLYFAYTTGVYVGASRVRVEAMKAGAGHYEILGDGLWHWTPDPARVRLMWPPKVNNRFAI